MNFHQSIKPIDNKILSFSYVGWNGRENHQHWECRENIQRNGLEDRLGCWSRQSNGRPAELPSFDHTGRCVSDAGTVSGKELAFHWFRSSYHVKWSMNIFKLAPDYNYRFFYCCNDYTTTLLLQNCYRVVEIVLYYNVWLMMHIRHAPSQMTRY